MRRIGRQLRYRRQPLPLALALLLALALALLSGPGGRWVRDEVLAPAGIVLPTSTLPGGFSGPGAPWLVGAATVVDGDTIVLGGERIRLDGVDAPEAGQRCERERASWACGAEAGAALRAFLDGKAVRCVSTGQDRYGRVLAHCWAGGEDVGGWLVRQGLAVAYSRYSARYVMQEAEARRERRGLWAGRFEQPEEWRRRHPR